MKALLAQPAGDKPSVASDSSTQPKELAEPEEALIDGSLGDADSETPIVPTLDGDQFDFNF